MVKNIKLDDAMHQEMSIRAAELDVRKHELISAALKLGLAMGNEEIMAAINAAKNAKTERPNQD